MTVTKPKDRKVHISLPEDVHQRLRVKCAVRDATIQEYVARLISESVDGIVVSEAGTSYGAGRDPKASTRKPSFLDFFAGSGLVTEALSSSFSAAWANDICEKKAAVFRANHAGRQFHLGPIEEVTGRCLPSATLSWASFPCQDLSLAGNMEGIDSARSGLVWHWLRVMDEMPQRPPLVIAENVAGLVSASQGKHYRQLHKALVQRGYSVGAMILDARLWVPHSRPRVFVIGIESSISRNDYCVDGPQWCHPKSIQQVADGLHDWVWWKLPKPRCQKLSLEELIDFDAPCFTTAKAEKTLSLIPANHRMKMKSLSSNGHRVFPGYRRTRKGNQVLELRFDGIAGCLRTPEGGSSRQFLVIRNGKGFNARLITVNEAAKLMGLPDGYKLPGSYNDGYRALGDAVAVPVVRHLGDKLLLPLAELVYRKDVLFA